MLAQSGLALLVLSDQLSEEQVLEAGKLLLILRALESEPPADSSGTPPETAEKAV